DRTLLARRAHRPTARFRRGAPRGARRSHPGAHPLSNGESAREAYRPCAEFIGRRLARRGFELTYVRAEGTPGDSERWPRVNVIARRESGLPGPCVHFNGHIDVVQTGAGWTFEPFAGTVRDGKLFGRGACDMKGGLAAAI